MTKNHDMVMLCAEKNVSVVWLDPYRRHLRLDEQAGMAFDGIVQWCELLSAASEAVCVRVLRTRVHVYPVVKGAEMAERRYRAIQKRKAQERRQRRARPDGAQLSTDV